MNKNMAAAIMIGLVIGAALGYLVLPILFPSVADGEAGKLLQTKYNEFDSNAQCFDWETSWKLVTNTTLSITTQGASYLLIQFNTMYMHFLDSTHDEFSQYTLNLTINNQTECLGMIGYYVEDPLGMIIRLYDSFILTAVTNPLPAGTYTIAVYWRSEVSDPTTASSVTLYLGTAFEYNRSLLVQEIHI
jgi:hypothetical protein